MGKIYCQGKRTTKTQAVCLELGPLCSISEFPFPTQPPPPAGVIRGAFPGAVQSYLTFSIKLLTLSDLTCSITYILAKRCCSEMQNLFEFARTTEKFALNRCSLSYAGFLARNVLRVFAPPRNVLRPLRGWREGTDDISNYDLVLFPPQCHFSENTGKEFIIVFKEGLRD